MSSPINPLVKASHRTVAFWLPPGGTDNGVWATNWAELADLHPDDVAAVLHLLACAGVGGYVATVRRRTHHAEPIQRLWVDSLQYHRAEDILMAYLNARADA
jgi:hypothetical protein